MTANPFDIEELTAALPFVKKIDFELVTNAKAGTKIVKVKPMLVDGTRAVIECPDMPPTSRVLIQVICACCHQVVHPFARQQKITMDGGRCRVQARESDGSVQAAPPIALPLGLDLPGLPVFQDVVEAIAVDLGLESQRRVIQVDDQGGLNDAAGVPIISDDGLKPVTEPSAAIGVRVEALSDEDADELIRELDEADAAIATAIEVVK